MKISDIFRIRDDAQFQINTECAAGGFRPPLISPAIVRIVLENSGAPLLLAELERIVEMDTGELGHEYETDWKIARAAISAARGSDGPTDDTQCRHCQSEAEKVVK